MPDINILLSTDDGHAPYAAAVIRSVVFSSNADDHLAFYILTLGMYSENLEKFKDLSKDLGVEVNVVEADSSLVERLPDKGRTKTAYLRMFAGEILPHVSKVIYLDTDILVRGSLSDMYHYQQEFPAGSAVRDPATVTGWSGLQKEVPSGFDRSRYFNSGVMLMNLDFLREKNASETLVKIRTDNVDSVLHDQSALNIFLEGKIALLPFRFNYVNQVYDKIVEKGLPGASELVEFYDDPVIVHFSHYKKPWLRVYPQRFASEFQSHLRSTPWGEGAIPGMSIKQHLARTVRMLVHFFNQMRWRMKRTLMS